ncbi:MAG TPA: divalent-cation tolerance protein CutA [Burkholderiales bacterium]|nr:divalent-cation tolerance protein CutA [Burkholderiales bacterium]
MTDTVDTDAVVVITNLPDRETAMKLAQTLVEKRLAACVNVLAACASVYRWKEEIETAQEVPLLIKTRAALYSEVEAVIRGHHPYELPEIIAVSVMRGFPGYLDWVTVETTVSIG